MKRITIVGLILLISMGSVSGCDSRGYELHLSPNNVLEYPNEGWVYSYCCYQDIAINSDQNLDYNTGGNNIYIDFSGSGYTYLNDSSSTSSTQRCSVYDGGFTYAFDRTESETFSTTGDNDVYTDGSGYGNIARLKIQGSIGSSGQSWDDYSSCSAIFYISLADQYLFNNTGTVCGINWIQQYIWNGSAYLELTNTTGLNITGDSYSLKINNQSQYKLLFSDGHDYVFTCDGVDVNYDRNICDYYTLNLLDNCANLLINPHTTIFRDMTEVIYDGYDNPVALQNGVDINISDYIQIIIDTTDGAVQYNDYASIIEQDFYHTTISWNMNLHIVDDNTDTDIVNANVVLSQECSVDLPNIKNVISTVTGHAIFTGLSNSNMNVTVTKTGYNTYSKTLNIGSIFNCWSNGGTFTVYMNGTTGNSTDDYQNSTHNDSAADGTGEETLPEDQGWGCGVYFKNTDNIITDTIHDTDTHVDMYYWIKGSDATLKFQHQLYTYWYTDEEYSVSNNTFEYRRILNANFSDYTDAYRGYIYNATHDCNSVQRLYVINQTYEAETDYENLTAHCWIKNKLSGNEIDYRSDIKCVIYANSTNASLLDITAHFMNQSTEVDSIVLNWADFVSGSPKWYYTWYPTYEYESGYNYTLNITGFDGQQLDTDEVWTADIVGNTLTVYVKDNHNTPLTYSTIFVQGWGSTALDSLTDISITGLSDGNVQYKAIKSGYLSSSWSNITLDGSDESVTCILTERATESVTGYKLKDSEIKEFFIPLMYMLLIMILIGGLMNAAKK